MAHVDTQDEGTSSGRREEAFSTDEERGGQKRSRSPSTPPPSQQRKSQRTHQSPSSPLLQRSSRSPHSSPRHNLRRRSEHAVDETFRGRTRQRSRSKRRQSSTISEEEEQPPSRDPRHRSPSPSRGPMKQTEMSPPFRRRRSLPNHYERTHQDPQNKGNIPTSPHDGDDLDGGGDDGERAAFADRHHDKNVELHGGDGEMDLDGTQEKKTNVESGPSRRAR